MHYFKKWDQTLTSQISTSTVAGYSESEGYCFVTEAAKGGGKEG